MRNDLLISKLEHQAATLRREAYALSIAARDSRTPWYAKAFMGLVLAYAFSPIDLIPDFVPGLGFLDDLLIVPLGIYFSLKMIPPQVMAEARQQADHRMTQAKPLRWAGGIMVILIWVVAFAAVVWLILRLVLK